MVNWTSDDLFSFDGHVSLQFEYQ